MFFVLLSGVAQVYVPRLSDEGSSKSLYDDGQKRQLLELDAVEFTTQSWPSWQEPPTRPPRPDDLHWDSITITSGSPQQILVAADTDLRAKGHLTFYPGDGETVALQIPFREGGLDRSWYRVAHDGACRGDE
jgi:hypothetical protein